MTETQPATDLLVVHAAFVRRLAQALAGDAADDVAQDAWVRALAAAPPRFGVRAWLAAITGNVWKNSRRADARRDRKHREHRERCEIAAAKAVPSVDEIVEREEVRRRVVTAVLQLPETVRAVVLLRFYEGLDSHAIGERLQRPASTVRSQLGSALAQLRERLDRDHGEQRRAWLLPLAAWRTALTTASVALRVGWPVRIAAAAVLLLAAAAFLLPPMLRDAPPALPGSPIARTNDVPHTASQEQAARTPAPVAAAAPADLDATRLRGRVVTGPEERPVPGAFVELQRCEADEFDPYLDADLARTVAVLATATADADGRFEFPVRRAAVHRVHARSAGFVGTRRWCTGGTDVTVRVAAVAAVSGVVRDAATREPVAGATVRVTMAGTSPIDVSVELAQATTVDDGTFRFPQLPPTTISVRAMHERLADAHQQIELQAGGEHQVELALAAGHVITGRVTDAVSGAPLPGAEVSDDKSFARKVVADRDGRYRLPGCDANLGALMFARADGYAPGWLQQPTSDEDGRRDIAMRRAGSVRGRFVDEQGRGVGGLFAGAGAQFEISIGEATDWHRASVEADGRFSISGLDPTNHYSMIVRGGDIGARVIVLPREVPADDVLDLGDVVVRPAGEFRGRVVDDAGAPLGGARVYLQGLDERAWLLVGRRTESLEVSQFLSRARSANDDGTFCFGGLATGSYRLLVMMPGRGWQAEFGPYDVRDGEARARVIVKIELGRVIAGTLRLDSGLPLPQWESVVLLAERRGTRQAARVAADGSFRFERLDDGEHTIRAFRVPDGWSLPKQRGVAPGTKDLVLTLVRAATVEGRVVGADGKPRRAQVICWHDGSGEDQLTDAEGRFRFEVAPDYAGRLTASDPENEALQVTVENVTAGARDLVLRLR